MIDLPSGGRYPPASAAEREPQMSDAVAKAREAARTQSERLTSKVQEKLDDARTAAERRADEGKEHAADQFAQTARALEDAADRVDAGTAQRQMLSQAAEGLMRISDSIRGRSLGDVVSDISDFGRRNPAAFLSGAALAGFALARFAVAGAHPSGHHLGAPALERHPPGELTGGIGNV
jgi:hypothetical protein